MNIGYAIALQALYGTTLTASKILVSFAAPIFIIGIRMTLAGSLLLIYQAITKKKIFNLPKSSWSYVLQFAFFNIYLPYVLRYMSLQYLSVSKVSLYFYLTPLISYILSCLIGIQKSCHRKWIGITISFLGFLPSLLDYNQIAPTEYTLGFFSLAEFAMLVAIISQSYSWIVMQKITNLKINISAVNGFSMLIGGILAFITSFILKDNLTISNPLQFSAWLGFVIIITNIIFYNGQAILLKRFSATIIALTGLCAPLIATLTSAIILREPITWQFIFSSITLAVGVYIFYQTENKALPEVQ